MKEGMWTKGSGVITFFLLLISFSCDKNQVNPSSRNDKEITSFKLEVKNNPQLLTDVTCYINGTNIIGRILYTNVTESSSVNSFVATFSSTGMNVRVDSVLQESGVSSNNINNPVIYTIEAEDHSTKNYTVQLFESTGLPIVFVNTDNSVAITSKDDYVTGSVFISGGAEASSADFSGMMQIKGHGNTTWGMPKKPYKIKLTSKASLLGMPADKEWILLANYSDKTLMRNYLAFEISNRIGLTYTPRSQYVELFLNGTYQGNYQLSEQVKVASSRVNIVEMDNKDTSGKNLTGGYLLEVDTRLDEDFYFWTKRVPFTIQSPDDILPVQLSYINSYAQQAEDALFSDSFADPVTGYEKYIDSDSFIKWYLVNELFKNNDADFNSSVYMYKDRNGKLAMGPVWDFDIAAGNINYNDNNNPQGWWVRNASWMARLFEDPSFEKRVEAKWAELQVSLVAIDSFIDKTSSTLARSQYNNFTKWDILSSYVWPNAIVTGSYKGEVNYLKDWMRKRISWMDSQLTKSN